MLARKGLFVVETWCHSVAGTGLFVAEASYYFESVEDTLGERMAQTLAQLVAHIVVASVEP